MRYLGTCSYGVASRSGTRYPRINGRSGDSHLNDFPRLQLDNEESKERVEEEIGDLQEITRPDVFGVIVKKGYPTLPSCSWLVGLLHILLDRSLAHPNAKLEEFTTNALGSEDVD
jgi:hypothetical protein